jgi:flagellar hook-associated protein 3 FlgL
VSNQLIAQTVLSDTERSTERLLKIQSQLSSGKKIEVPSDDPVAAGVALRFQNNLEQTELFLKNIQDGINRLNGGEAALGDINKIAIDIKQHILDQADETSSAETRAAIASVVGETLDELIRIADRKVEGRYLFGGFQTQTAPFSRVGGYVRYDGDTGQALLPVSEGLKEQMNLPANEVFGALSTQVTGATNLNPLADLNTLLDDLRGGLGVQRGRIRVQDGLGTDATVDLTTAQTLGDVRDRLQNAVSGLTVDVIASGGGSSIRLTKGGATFTVTEVGGGTTASHLGILSASGTPTPLVGSDINPKLAGQTLLANLNNGAGLPAGGIVITNGTYSATLSFASDTTVEALLNRINGAGVSVDASINSAGTGINILSRLSGAELRIAENGGTTGGSLGVLSLTGSTLLSSLNRGIGVSTQTGDDFRITAKDGVAIDVEISSAVTIQNVIDAINADAQNGGRIVASLAASGGNGLRLTDTTGGAGALSVTDLGSPAAQHLGILKSSAGATLQGDDVNPIVAKNMFTVLIDLQSALQNNDTDGIDRAGLLHDEVYQTFLQTRGSVGGRIARLEATQGHLERQKVEFQKLLSETEDVDFAEVATRLGLLQMTLEASLRSTAQIMRLTLASFL